MQLQKSQEQSENSIVRPTNIYVKNQRKSVFARISIAYQADWYDRTQSI